MTDKIYIFDTTLRDGEQVPGCQLSTVEKVEVAKQLEKLGVDIIEAGFPVSSPGDFQSVMEISKAVTEPTICALTRAVEGDIDAAVESLKYAKRGRIHTGIGASDHHIQHKFHSTRDEVLERGVAAVKYAKKFVEDVEFYAEDAGRADLEYLARMIEAVIAAGATVVNIPDTTGYCTPDQYGAKILYLKENVKGIDKAIISCHCHDDLGLATANTLAGVINGARQVEVTINGIGERAGNTSLEEIAMILRTHKGLALDTDIVTEHIFATSKMVSQMMNMPVQPNKAIVGRNAFAHSSGIHQDGVLKHKENYEILSPEDVGVPSNAIILTARSGRAALKHHLGRIGHHLEGEKLDEVYKKYLELADKKKNINEEDLNKLVGGEQSDRLIELVEIRITCGQPLRSMAMVEVKKGGELVTETAWGNGPVDAAVKAIDKIVRKDIVLEELLVQSISGGSDDFSKVHMEVRYGEKFFSGFGANTDIVVASAQAYIDALNKLV